MALRDQNWDTLPTIFSNWKYDVEPDSFNISFVAENRHREINYKWHGSIVGDSSGKITYSMSGLAQSDFKKRIIGLCALFPVKECAGQTASVLRHNEEKLQTFFPYNISSQQPLPGFEDVSELNYSANGIPVSVKFDGDQFEMEDQRSFTDASFKVYSTWNRNAVEGDLVRAGDKFTQSISVSIDQNARNEVSQPIIDTGHHVTIELQGSETYQLPRVGLGKSSVNESLTEKEALLLRGLRMAHLRCDLDLSSGKWEALFQQACKQAVQLGVDLEVALFVNSKEAKSELEQFKLALEKFLPSVSSILIFDNDGFVTATQSVRICQEFLGGYKKSNPKIGGGTNRNYFDLAFGNPAFEPQDLVSYSVNPQVHAFDVSSLFETLEGQSWTITSAHKIYPKNFVAISPVTLKPRFNPDEVVASEADPNELPPQVDSRQMSLFGACWTAGSIKSLAQFGAYSLTFYETVGWRGVLETERGSPLPTKFFSKPGMVFPLYHVIADVCEVADGRVLPTKSSRPLSADALVIARDNGYRVIVYNLTWSAQDVSLRGVNASRVNMRRLNSETVTEAISNAVEFRKNYSEQVKFAERGVLDLSLRPYEVATLDFE